MKKETSPFKKNLIFLPISVAITIGILLMFSDSPIDPFTIGIRIVCMVLFFAIGYISKIPSDTY